jgi:hypothetical protein
MSVLAPPAKTDEYTPAAIDQSVVALFNQIQQHQHVDLSSEVFYNKLYTGIAQIRHLKRISCKSVSINMQQSPNSFARMCRKQQSLSVNQTFELAKALQVSISLLMIYSGCYIFFTDNKGLIRGISSNHTEALYLPISKTRNTQPAINNSK